MSDHQANLECSEARLAAALPDLLLDICTNSEYQQMDAIGKAAEMLVLEWHEAQDRYVRTSKTQPILNTLAADLALAAAVRSQLGGWRFTGGDVRQALKVLGPPGTKGEGIVMIAADAAATISDDLVAIEEALTDD